MAVLTQSYQAETTQIVADVFSSMMQLNVYAVDDAPPMGSPVMTAAIHFVGSWKGALRIECTPEQTFEFAHRLLNIELPTEVNEDVCDSYGELANMIGGNLKAVLPRLVHLSMPSVIRGENYAMQICQAVTVCRQAFQSEYGAFWVTLVEFIEV